MEELELNAIKATIMDALVYTGAIDKEKEFLYLENFVIDDDEKHYHYEKNPDICGIPLWMKDEFRKHCLKITGGRPISLFLAKPPLKTIRFCVYDANTAVSSIFDDATFYEVIYTSPTRHIKLENSKPFVEVNINGENYLIDVLTKRIIKSLFFKENFGFDVTYCCTLNELSDKQKKNLSGKC